MNARVLLISLLAAFQPFLQAAPLESQSAVRRFALVAGTNDGGSKRVKLRYAHSDAATFAGVLTELGGVATRDLVLIQGADRKGFLAALDRMKSRIAEAAGPEAAGSAARLELLVYYSGHSDESGLLLGEEKVRYDEFRARIDAVPAKIRLAVVDACASGALTRLKGGKRLPAFAVDQSSRLSGYAFLTSSSGTESAQESDRIRASFFTHYLVTGLRGAADLNLDGKVTLGEAYEFAFHETLSQTEGSQAGAQHPSYDMRLTGTGDLVLTDLRGTSAGLVLDRKLQGRLYVRSSTGSLVAELQKHPGRKVELGLEPGLYDMRLDQGNAYFRSLFKVDSLTHHPVSLANFEPAPRERNRERGDGAPDAADSTDASPATAAAPASDAWIPARAAFIPSLGFPGNGELLWSHNVSLNLIAGEARSIHGLQISLLTNRSHEHLDGMQLAVAFNRAAGASRGLQVAALANLSEGRYDGLQISSGMNRAARFQGAQLGAFNTLGEGRGMQGGVINAAGRSTGLQAGIANGAGDQAGLQAGVVNGARRKKGLQAGVINAAVSGQGLQAGVLNVAGDWTGLQVGVVNIAPRAEGAVIGLLNIIGNGIHDLDVTVDEKSMLRTALVLGGPYNYTYFSFDMKGLKPRHLWGGSAGLGLHLPRKPFYLEADFGGGWLGNEVDWDNYSLTGRSRAIFGYQPMRYFSVFGGLSYNLEAWPGSQRPNLNPGSTGDRLGDDLRHERWLGFFLGVRL